ncbi:murein hydrolase activator EnvC family protein [Paenibacillus gansuensis]|uniref:Murein hydrolase activator EnvC family protein n=1 Tax=Paenibacillus gansuensis TaxID=306542 RepID=A0ABW5PL98_9BACL
MKKLFLPLLLTAGLLAPVALPSPGFAVSEIDKINQQLKEVKKQQESAAWQARQAEKNIAGVQYKRKITAQGLEVLMGEIDKVGNAMNAYNSQIGDRTEKLQKTGEELQEAMNRVKERDSMLRDRIRLMYTNGFVSYLDVLFSSTSFSDFLDRYDALKSIVNEDKSILATNKKDQAQIAEQKKSVEAQLAEVKQLYAKMEEQHQYLASKEREKEVMIASLHAQEHALEEIGEEMEQELMQLARKRSSLNAEANKIKEEQARKRKAAEAKRRAAEAKRNKRHSVASASNSESYSGGELASPLHGGLRVTSDFGYRTHPVTGERESFHKGADFGAPNGTPIYAAESGEVIVAQWWNGYGNCVIIDHGGGMWTVYGHIRNGGIKVSEGDMVKRGEKIAEVGSTGRSTGNHLHFEVRINEEPVNPLPYLR